MQQLQALLGPYYGYISSYWPMFPSQHCSVHLYSSANNGDRSLRREYMRYVSGQRACIYLYLYLLRFLFDNEWLWKRLIHIIHWSHFGGCKIKLISLTATCLLYYLSMERNRARLSVYPIHKSIRLIFYTASELNAF